MTDLPPARADRAAALLAVQGAALARFHHLLDAQRAAFRGDDLSLLAELAGQASHLLEELEAGSRDLATLARDLANYAGHRATSLRGQLHQVTAGLDHAHGATRQLVLQVSAGRNHMVEQIRLLEGQGPSLRGRSCRVSPADPSILDRSG